MSVSQNFAAQGIPFPLEGGTPAAKITIDTPLGPFGPAYTNAFTIPIQAGPGKYVLVGALYLTHTVPQGQWIGTVLLNGLDIYTKTTVISDGGGQAVINIIAPLTWTGSLATIQVQLGCQSGQVIFSKLVALNIKTI